MNVKKSALVISPCEHTAHVVCKSITDIQLSMEKLDSRFVEVVTAYFILPRGRTRLKLFLDSGANVNAQGAVSHQPLSQRLAIKLNNCCNAQKAQGGFYGYKLLAATLNGKVEAMQLLLDEGAGC